jgi:hypothetical protein
MPSYPALEPWLKTFVLHQPNNTTRAPFQLPKLSVMTPHLEQFLVLRPPPDGDGSVSVPRENIPSLPGASASSSTLEATSGYDQVRELLHRGVMKPSDLATPI